MVISTPKGNKVAGMCEVDIANYVEQTTQGKGIALYKLYLLRKT